MRLRIQRGQNLFEVEGTAEEVEAAVTRWMPLVGSPAPPLGDHLDIPLTAPAIVAAIKADERYPYFHKKLILHHSSRLHKIKFVLWFSPGPLSSGQIAKVLVGLGTKMVLPNVSLELRGHQSEFIFDKPRKRGGGATTRYRLTDAAHHEFEGWLLGSGRGGAQVRLEPATDYANTGGNGGYSNLVPDTGP